LCCGIGKVGGL
jgi:hypothetical protein